MSPSSVKQNNSATVTLEEYAAAKRLPLGFLEKLGLRNVKYQGGDAIRIPYFDEMFVEVAVRLRTALDKSDNNSRFRWKTRSKPLLYGLWLRTGLDYVVLPEGESDCQTLWYHGFPALGVPGATNWKESRDAHHMQRFTRIYVVVEPDKGGAAVLNWLTKSTILDRAYLLTLNGFKDPSALHLDNPGQFRERFEEAISAAIPASQALASQIAIEKIEAWDKCKRLAESPEILDHFAAALRSRGVVGVDQNAKVVFLALMSRFLERPVSLALKGPSSGGKSYILEQVLYFFPKSAAYCLTAMSDRALAYTDADLQHKFLVLYEAAGISSAITSYFIRSLLSEGRLAYEVVEKTADGLKPRRIEKMGPTGLIVTTTAVTLHPENETRLLSLQVADSQEQTMAILRAIAKTPQAPTDLTPWLALQEWIARGEHGVVIPFAERLAELIPPVAVRLRRDFGAMLALIKAHAILHQKSRRRDDGGKIIATIDDYSAIRELVSDILSQNVDVTVNQSTRETVTAVEYLLQKGLGEVSLRLLAGHLRLDKSATSRRVRTAIQDGYLKNLEDRTGHPSRLVLGDPIPDDTELLPSREVLQRCSVESGGCVSTAKRQSSRPIDSAGLDASTETDDTAKISAKSGLVVEVEI